MNSAIIEAMDDSTICVIGAGYVGLVTGACLADNGKTVRLVEVNPARLERLQRGESPIYEPGLQELISKSIAAGRLTFTADIHQGIARAGIVIIAVGTPALPDGGADLKQVRSALSQIADSAEPGAVVAIKSTVPPSTTSALAIVLRRKREDLVLVACPEFLREGNALGDSHNPARVVVGGEDQTACRRVANLFVGPDSQVILTDSVSAEIIKYGSNAFLALKISFINELARLSELVGGDVESVADGLGSDPRIGRAFLNAGLGFGGSCFPKDVSALDDIASYYGHSFWLLKAATEVNLQQRRRFVARVQQAFEGDIEEKRIAVLGLSFKAGTDDTRQAASIDVIRHLVRFGAHVAAYDPVAEGSALGKEFGFTVADSALECVEGADAVLLVTEWPEFRELDWQQVATRVAQRLVFDGRNFLNGEELRDLGFTYHSVGRDTLEPLTSDATQPVG